LIESIYFRIADYRFRLLEKIRSEFGQTTAEYVAITAVGVTLAVGVVFGLLKTELDSAVGGIGDKITNFLANPG
jgi:hypothetical protein